MGLPLKASQPVDRATEVEISSEDRRFGTPPLRPLPLETVYNPLPPFVKQCHNDLISKVEEILARHGLFEVSVRLLHRQVPDRPETATLTLFIAPRGMPFGASAPFEDVVRSVKVLIDEYFSSRGHQDLDLCVELIDLVLIWEDRYGKSLSELDLPELQKEWSDHLLPSIEAIMKDHGLDDVDIELEREGYSTGQSRNPLVVTIYLDPPGHMGAGELYGLSQKVRERLEGMGWGNLLVDAPRFIDGWNEFFD